jgi:hypothetical protein
MHDNGGDQEGFRKMRKALTDIISNIEESLAGDILADPSIPGSIQKCAVIVILDKITLVF